MTSLEIVIGFPARQGLTQCTRADTVRLDILVMFLLLNPPLVVKPGVLPPASFFVHPRPAGFSRRNRRIPPGRKEPAGYVLDASKMLPMDPSSIALNSSSVCCAVSPSVRAREKLAMTPGLRIIRALASSRV